MKKDDRIGLEILLYRYIKVYRGVYIYIHIVYKSGDKRADNGRRLLFRGSCHTNWFPPEYMYIYGGVFVRGISPMTLRGLWHMEEEKRKRKDMGN